MKFNPLQTIREAKAQDKDPEFLAMMCQNDVRASLACGLFAIVIGIAGVFGSVAHKATMQVIPVLPANAIYLFLITYNVPAVFLSLYSLKNDIWLNTKLIMRLTFIHILINMFFGCATIFSTQTGSSFYFETVLIIAPLAMLPVYRISSLLIVFIGGCILLMTMVKSAGIYIGWQDQYDIFLFFIFCIFIALSRRQWFLKQFQQEMKLREMNRLLHTKSRTDALTKLPNRTALYEDFSSFHGKYICAAMMDIDDFKNINDSKGHDAGDEMLQYLGHTLESIFPVGCYRYGGDEFLILFTQGSEAQFASKLTELQEKFHKSGESITIGYAYGNISGERELRSIITSADSNLYIQKKTKKGGLRGSAF